MVIYICSRCWQGRYVEGVRWMVRKGALNQAPFRIGMDQRYSVVIF